ncbi:hypothetical protein C8J56DRAFT_969497 [Mycena floridula]|nr:hypothetical protein C8J56DRAFT_969497 [Mycena floridula]
MSPRQPFSGTRRKLVLGFDVGTTFSGISYSILDPGIAPEIKSVTRFPAQEQVGGDAKIPSIIYYDEKGVLKGVGAEALELKDWVVENNQEKNWFLAEWFKLELRPKSTLPVNAARRNLLPPGKTIVQVFADFLGYLFRCAKIYIQESCPNGLEFWATIANDIEFVLTHPNGWEGAQQNQMRQAAALAGIIPNSDDGQARIRFVTEGEASLHFCIHHGLAGYTSKPEEAVIIVDAGGGTIDITSYAGSSNGSFQEIARPACHFAGSVYVLRHARLFLWQRLQGSKYSADLEHILQCFDRGPKMKFKTPADPSFIKFGSMGDNDPARDIKSGQLKLAGADIAAFFEPSIHTICQTVLAQRASTQKKITTVFLVGGFAASEYLFATLQQRLQAYNLTFCRPDGHVNKAVADGAVSFYLDHFVTERVSKVTYGTEYDVDYDAGDPEHLARASDSFTCFDGAERIPSGFSILLAKDTLVSETTEFRESFARSQTEITQTIFTDDILCYRGRDPNPRWIDVDAAMYTVACSVVTDFSTVLKKLKPTPTSDGMPPHYKLHYDIIMLFGLTELKALVAWKEDGVEKRSPAKLIYI